MDPMSKDPGYEFTYSVPPRWVQLPLQENRESLRRDKKAEAWSIQQARAMLGADSATEKLTQRATELAKLTYEARARGAMDGLRSSAGSWFDFMAPVRANPPTDVYVSAS
jgi:hypothetical protein